MKKLDFNQAVTLLANFGVIAGMVFLGIELRQNTKSIQTSAYQDLLGQISVYRELAVQNPRLQQRVTTLTSFDAANDDDHAVIQMYVLSFRLGDMAYYQYQMGAISSERFESSTALTRRLLCFPFGEFVWSLFRDDFVAGYQEYLDRVLAECA